jgi:hypothetical protein
MMNNIQLGLLTRLDNNQYPTTRKNKIPDINTVHIKYGGYIVVCHPGTTEVAKSNEKGMVKRSNKTRKAMNGI